MAAVWPDFFLVKLFNSSKFIRLKVFAIYDSHFSLLTTIQSTAKMLFLELKCKLFAITMTQL